MPNTKRFNELTKRISELRRHMLPRRFSPTGTYTGCTQDRARGYRLLVHAEIEAYLEDMAKDVVIDRIREWKTHRTPSLLLLAFLACFHSGWVPYDDSHNIKLIELAKSRRRVKDTIEEVVDLAQSQFVQRLKDNHGVREENLRTLILPTGIELDELDPTWIADLDDFGKQRGDVAHQSKGTTGSINPEDEYTRVENIMKGLSELDEKLSEIVKTVVA